MKNCHHSTTNLSNDQEIKAEIARIETVIQNINILQDQISRREEEISNEYDALNLDSSQDAERIRQIGVERLGNTIKQAQIVGDQIQALDDYNRVVLRQLELVQVPDTSGQEEELRDMLDFLEKQRIEFCKQRETMLCNAEEEKKRNFIEDASNKLYLEITQVKKLIQEDANHRNGVDGVLQQVVGEVAQLQLQPQNQQQQMQQSMLREGVAGKNGMHLGQVRAQSTQKKSDSNSRYNSV